MRRALAAVALLAAAAALWRAARHPSPPAPSSGRLALLREVLATKNDNDRRLDLAFEELTPAEKGEFRDEYRRLPREARNERGTIVFLLGRSLSGAEDWAFMKEAAAEPPCLGLADCTRRDPSAEPGEAVTLAYPALVALKRAEAALVAPAATDADRAGARAVVAAGVASPAPAEARLARRIAERFAPSEKTPPEK